MLGELLITGGEKWMVLWVVALVGQRIFPKVMVYLWSESWDLSLHSPWVQVWGQNP